MTKLLFWLKFYNIISIFLIIIFNLNLNSLMSTILTSELIIIFLFVMFLFNAIIYNLNWILGFVFIIIILGGLEIALSFLLLNL